LSCVERLYLPVILEIDSLALIKILRGDWDCPWSIVMIIRRIRELIEGGLIQLQHTHREGNNATDFLANRCLVLQGQNALIHLQHYQGRLKA